MSEDLSGLKGRRVLVVEDSEDNRLLVKLLLSRRGMQVDFAENGQIAVEMAPAGHYDFVLMDMQMPVKDGYAATRELRQVGYVQPHRGVDRARHERGPGAVPGGGL